MNSIRALGVSFQNGIITTSETVNKGLNGFESLLNFSRVGSGILGTVVNFPKIYKTVTDQQAARFFTVFSDALAPVNNVAGQLKTCLNFFELSVRLAKLKELTKRDWQKGGALQRNGKQAVALGLQIIQKTTESIFIEPTGKKWNWYHLDTVTGGFNRWTGLKVSGLALVIIKDSCVFFSAIFAQWGAVSDKAAVLRKLRSKQDSKNDLTTPDPFNQKEYQAKLASTDKTIRDLLAKLNKLDAVKQDKDLTTKRNSYYDLLIEDQTNEAKRLTNAFGIEKTAKDPDTKAAPEKVVTINNYNTFIAWIQLIGIGVEQRRLEAAKANPALEGKAITVELRKINAELDRRENELTEKFNKNVSKVKRQFVIVHSAAHRAQYDKVVDYKLRKKTVQIANLHYDLDKLSWGKWFDISKMTIAPLGTLCVLKDACSPTGFLGRQFNRTPYIGKFLEAALFFNILATSVIGFKRTCHMAYVEKTPLPQPRTLGGVRR